MAHSSRGWTGARTPSSIKNVRQAARRRAINQPRRTAAKSLVNKAILEAGNGNAEEAREALVRAISALDRAAKAGAIHRNAADRRKSRLTLKVAAALGGEALTGTGKATRSTGKAAAAKQARARIAAGRAAKAKGAQTSVGKAREALSRTTRGAAAESAEKSAPKASGSTKAPAKPAAKASTKTAAKSTPKGSPAKAASPRASATKPAAKSSAAKGAASSKTTKKG